MRDAFGGIVNITMIVVFLVIVSGYLAFNVTYTKAFRMKNKIITTLEQYEGCETNSQKCIQILDEYASNIGYNTDLNEIADIKSDGYTCQHKGYCWLRKQNNENSDSSKSYYQVVTAISIDIPIINKVMANMQVFRLSGSTKLIKVN